MATKQDVIKRLNLFRDDQEFAVTIWTTGDVISVADDMGYPLTIEQAVEIVEDIDRHQDAEVGISWAVIQVHVGDYAQAHGLEKTDDEHSGRAG